MANVTVSITIDSTVIDAVRNEGESNVQVVSRCVASAARNPLRGIHRATEKAKIDLTARDTAAQTISDAETALKAAEDTADANVERLLS